MKFYNELLVKYGSVSIHHQNLQKLAVEMLKVSRGLNSETVNDLLKFREQIPYELRQRPQFQIPWVHHSVFSGTESLKFHPSKILAMVPNEMKQLESLQKTMETMENNGNLDPVLADYAIDIFVGFGSLIKNHFNK